MTNLQDMEIIKITSKVQARQEVEGLRYEISYTTTGAEGVVETINAQVYDGDTWVGTADYSGAGSVSGNAQSIEVWAKIAAEMPGIVAEIRRPGAEV